MSCTLACHNPTPSQAHCGVCHVTFGGPSLFVRHRRGGACVDPTELGMTKIGEVWRIPMSEEERSRRFPLHGVSAEPRTGRGRVAAGMGRSGPPEAPLRGVA